MSFKIRMKDGESITTICNNEFVVTVTYRDGEYLLSSLHIKDKADKESLATILSKHINEILSKIPKLAF